MGGTGVIDRFLEVFTSYIDSGFGLLNGEVAFLSSTLVVLDIALAGLFWALASDEDVIARLIRKTLYVGFFAFLIGNFNTLAKVILNSFAGLGLKAAGSGLSADQFVQPGRVAQVGIDAGKPILRSEEHTSELQSLRHLVCRLLLEKKKLKIDAVDAHRTSQLLRVHFIY